VAIQTAEAFGDDYGVGVVFTKDDPFFFVDLDKCLTPENTWSSVANDIMGRLSGAAVEVSQSGKGLHIFGMGEVPEHGCKNVPLGLELYTESRFVALTGTNMVGSADRDCSEALPGLVASYFAPKVGGSGESLGWTTEPVPEWNGPEDDSELILKAMSSKSINAIFSGKSSFAALWEGDPDALGASYPSLDDPTRPYDGSSADAALAQHLAFWTGKNCDRMLRLMQQSGLVREKWEREDYLTRTILNAVAFQKDVYSVAGTADTTVADSYGAVGLKGSEKQKPYAENIRAVKMAECVGDEATLQVLAKIPAAKTWIEAADKTPQEIATMVTPVESALDPLVAASGTPVVVNGYQYLGATEQIEFFKKCVYIQDIHRIFTPNGSLLKADQFNATYGGYVFQLDESGDKTTRKAWEAFTESQIVRFPKAESQCFRPTLESGALIRTEGRVLVNTYVPIDTERRKGDVAPFTTHLEKLLPNERDRKIILSYMAACVQYKGVKFQWTPLIQGAEGNGKSLLTWCVAFAIGEKYTHLPPANEIAEKFNDWLFNRLFIGVEDVYVPDHKKEVIEVIKPYITNRRLAKRAMQQGQEMHDVCANFILNSNHKDAIRKTRTDRRFAVFYTAQQTAEDIMRDGMGGSYFPMLYHWLQNGGYAIVNDFLHTFPIPDEFNPATNCHRAPITSSTNEAITASLGGVEQEILEAIDEGRPGFAGGWISSVAIEKLLSNLRPARSIAHNKRRDLLVALGYDWHPALLNGRVNNPIAIDEGKKPRLFIRAGHPHLAITSPGEVAKAYQAAQVMAASGQFNEVAHIFGQEAKV